MQYTELYVTIILYYIVYLIVFLIVIDKEGKYNKIRFYASDIILKKCRHILCLLQNGT